MVSQFEIWTDYLGSEYSSLFIGLFVGSLFGFGAQQSGFCLRTAVIEFWRYLMGKMVLIWLIAFSMSFFLSQLFIFYDQFDFSKVKNLNIRGSLSGAIVGGALFGIGMILARGCASRLLVLSATGNLRALFSFALIAIVAYQSIFGIFSNLRSSVRNLYSISPSERQFSLYLPDYFGILLGALLLILVLILALRLRLNFYNFLSASLVGISIFAGWALTSLHASLSFDIISVETLSFIGPAVQSLKSLTLMIPFKRGFEIGMMGGVFAGAFLGSLLKREFKFVFFTKESGILNYFIGSVLMGFGGVLAIGCSVGAGLSGVSILSVTALTSLVAMIFFAGLTDRLIN